MDYVVQYYSNFYIENLYSTVQYCYNVKSFLGIRNFWTIEDFKGFRSLGVEYTILYPPHPPP